jgi:hypothetical protein
MYCGGDRVCAAVHTAVMEMRVVTHCGNACQVMINGVWPCSLWKNPDTITVLVRGLPATAHVTRYKVALLLPYGLVGIHLWRT